MRNLYAILDAATSVGEIEKANMYDSKNIFVEGKTKDGDTYKLSLIIEKGEEKDA
jgi:hypothetical protein